MVNGCDCSIVIKTTHIEKDIPFSDETIRDAVSILQEEASIEGDGICRGLRKVTGVTGCVVTPLTIGTAPLLLYLAMGSASYPLYASETKNLTKYELNLLPTEDTEHFDLIQDRSSIHNSQFIMHNERKYYEGCRVSGFELRILRGEAIKLRLDVCGGCASRVYPYVDAFEREKSERFNSDFVTYKINDKEYSNIYGITLLSKKECGTRTEIFIKRALQNGSDIPEIIDTLVITAQLLRTQYEHSDYGMFRITLKKLVLVSDEADVNSVDTVIGPLRYYVADTVMTEVFASTGELIP